MRGLLSNMKKKKEGGTSKKKVPKKTNSSSSGEMVPPPEPKQADSPPPVPPATESAEVVAPEPAPPAAAPPAPAPAPAPAPVQEEEKANGDGGGSGSKKDDARSRRERTDNIFSTAINLEEEVFKPTAFKKSEAHFQFIDQALEDNFIFASLTEQERAMLIESMEVFQVPAGELIIKQGTTGDYFYVLYKGTVSFVVDKQTVGSVGPGGSFGELALLYNCPRGASCLAETPCKLWRVDQKTFRYTLANNSSTQQKELLETLRKVPFLNDLQHQDLVKISDAVTKVQYSAGDRIINKGDMGEEFYIIREGRVKVHDIGFGDSTYVDQEMGVGEFFGERALITGDPRMANITAVTSVVCLALSRETFEVVLGPLLDLVDVAMRKRTLLGVPAISNSQFQPHELARLTDRVREVDFPAGTVLAEEGKPFNHNIYIIRDGSVAIAKDGKIATKSDADYFGEDSVKEPDDAPSRYTITVQEDTSCGVISKMDIQRIIGPIQRLGQPPKNANQKGPDIKLKDLRKFRILGVGTFGKVWLVAHNKSGTPYALKVLGKREVIGHHQVEGVMREKNLMAAVKHPFVVNLVTTFQDERSLYMLIGLVQGGELFSIVHTEVRDGIPNGNSRFYAACILESLAALHRRDIVYRDLKPENVLIDRFGYCVLVDLGFAKVVTDKTFTLCGTPEYLAPEIILSKGHDKGADYWAFGVLIYEMLVGYSPFFSYDMDQVGLFKRIVSVKYGFPDGVVQDVAKHLIHHLLQRRQADRLGCQSRADQDIRDHKWFQIIHTAKLLNRQIPPPWRPRLKDPFDATHFDSYAHLENEPPPNYPPPTKEQQLLFKDFS
eukprot:CAMPEP_0172459820 /NCGR_PEP_ID=MMETSP1065-20121228/34298_1 /TAXON_ID=265537 /ORGANISM="Amphiprora paludosa, Strain CCMP125" /LENGTH=834 /DNA_ID=CAMNT_0013214661 /DNA_START=245 /DNA_END=2749 /DNA_ORIENTATION=+